MQLTFDIYKPEYAEAFYRLNINWLEEYFYVEPFDREVLSNPQNHIIDKAGHILFALLDGKVVGTVALMKSYLGEIELTKMAVDPNMRGMRIGQQLMAYCLAFAKENNMDRIILYSNRILENAIHIYRKFGFIEIPLETGNPYDRANIKMELIVTKTKKS